MELNLRTDCMNKKARKILIKTLEDKKKTGKSPKCFPLFRHCDHVVCLLHR